MTPAVLPMSRRPVRDGTLGLFLLACVLSEGFCQGAQAPPVEPMTDKALKSDLTTSKRPAIQTPAARSSLRARESSAWMVKNADTPPRPSLPAPPASTEDDPARLWSVEFADSTVRLSLKRWAKEAQWQLVWDADRDFVIDAEVQWHGTFEQALTALLESLRNSDYPLQARVHAASRVLRIQRLSPTPER